MLSIIKIQLFLFSNDKETYTDVIINEAKTISRITEQKDNENRLTTLLYFSLSLNCHLINEKENSLFLFRQTLDFTDKDEISNIQFEYLYFCFQEGVWRNRCEKLRKISNSFVKCSDKYLDKIVEKTCEYPYSFELIVNCLSSKFVLSVSDTFISVFSEVLKQAKLKGSVNLEEIECFWKSYKFQSLSIYEKQVQKQNFEDFVQRQNIENSHLGTALVLLVELVGYNDIIMHKAYNFLINHFQKNEVKVSAISLACYFCCEKKRKNALDEKYRQVLSIIDSCERMSLLQKNGDYYCEVLFALYKTLLYNNVDEKNGYYYADDYKSEYYLDKYNYYKDRKNEVKMANFIPTNHFDFFCGLYEIFRDDLAVYNDISSDEQKWLDSNDVKGFLESISQNNICAINEGKISVKYLKIYQLKDFEFAGKQEMLNKCEELAKSNNSNLNQLIIAKNRKFASRINQLLSELYKPIEFYDDEEE